MRAKCRLPERGVHENDGTLFYHATRTFLCPKQLERLKECGVIIKKGLFDEEEDRKIHENWAYYAQKNGVPLEAAYEYAGGYSVKKKMADEQLMHTRFLRETRFVPTMCRGMDDRTGIQVMARMRYLFQPRHDEGSNPRQKRATTIWTDEKINKLKYLVKRGFLVKQIQNEMGLTRAAVTYKIQKLGLTEATDETSSTLPLRELTPIERACFFRLISVAACKKRNATRDLMKVPLEIAVSKNFEDRTKKIDFGAVCVGMHLMRLTINQTKRYWLDEAEKLRQAYEECGRNMGKVIQKYNLPSRHVSVDEWQRILEIIDEQNAQSTWDIDKDLVHARMMEERITGFYTHCFYEGHYAVHQLRSTICEACRNIQEEIPAMRKLSLKDWLNILMEYNRATHWKFKGVTRYMRRGNLAVMKSLIVKQLTKIGISRDEIPNYEILARGPGRILPNFDEEPPSSGEEEYWNEEIAADMKVAKRIEGNNKMPEELKNICKERSEKSEDENVGGLNGVHPKDEQERFIPAHWKEGQGRLSANQSLLKCLPCKVEIGNGNGTETSSGLKIRKISVSECTEIMSETECWRSAKKDEFEGGQLGHLCDKGGTEGCLRRKTTRKGHQEKNVVTSKHKLLSSRSDEELIVHPFMALSPSPTISSNSSVAREGDSQKRMEQHGDVSSEKGAEKLNNSLTAADISGEPLVKGGFKKGHSRKSKKERKRPQGIQVSEKNDLKETAEENLYVDVSREKLACHLGSTDENNADSSGTGIKQLEKVNKGRKNKHRREETSKEFINDIYEVITSGKRDIHSEASVSGIAESVKEDQVDYDAERRRQKRLKKESKRREKQQSEVKVASFWEEEHVLIDMDVPLIQEGNLHEAKIDENRSHKEQNLESSLSDGDAKRKKKKRKMELKASGDKSIDSNTENDSEIEKKRLKMLKKERKKFRREQTSDAIDEGDDGEIREMESEAHELSVSAVVNCEVEDDDEMEKKRLKRLKKKERKKLAMKEVTDPKNGNGIGIMQRYVTDEPQEDLEECCQDSNIAEEMERKRRKELRKKKKLLECKQQLPSDKEAEIGTVGTESPVRDNGNRCETVIVEVASEDAERERKLLKRLRKEQKRLERERLAALSASSGGDIEKDDNEDRQTPSNGCGQEEGGTQEGYFVEVTSGMDNVKKHKKQNHEGNVPNNTKKAKKHKKRNHCKDIGCCDVSEDQFEESTAEEDETKAQLLKKLWKAERKGNESKIVRIRNLLEEYERSMNRKIYRREKREASDAEGKGNCKKDRKKGSLGEFICEFLLDIEFLKT